jgi:hypothetical protein
MKSKAIVRHFDYIDHAAIETGFFEGRIRNRVKSGKRRRVFRFAEILKLKDEFISGCQTCPRLSVLLITGMLLVDFF